MRGNRAGVAVIALRNCRARPARYSISGRASASISPFRPFCRGRAVFTPRGFMPCPVITGPRHTFALPPRAPPAPLSIFREPAASYSFAARAGELRRSRAPLCQRGLAIAEFRGDGPSREKDGREVGRASRWRGRYVYLYGVPYKCMRIRVRGLI